MGSITNDRQRFIERYLKGEGLASICAAMGRARSWGYKWLSRFEPTDPDWLLEQSRKPHHSPTRCSTELEELIKTTRMQLEQQNVFSGAQAIRWELEERQSQPLPSLRTIGRILVRQDLKHRRQGRYQPKGKLYPSPATEQPGAVTQSDFVGPRYLHGPIRFYSLNSVDVATVRCAVEPMLTRDSQAAIDAIWATWLRLGIPRYHQVDNEAIFYGSQAHPRGMGSLIRLCLLEGVQPWFIPPAEPWRNGVVEKFNHHWQQKFLLRTQLQSLEDLRRESLAFEQRHNSCYRYSRLGGKTPTAALLASTIGLRFPARMQSPVYPLPKPTAGRYHLVRFVRSEGMLDVFGEKFKVPKQAIYEYVRATVDVGQQKLGIYLDARLIEEYDYRMR